MKKYNTRDEDNFSQVCNRLFYYSIFFSGKELLVESPITVEEQSRLVFNIASRLKDAQPFIQSRAVRTYTQ